eukprot:1158503-Pelagomonas_calceolata.AAC.6
MWLKYPPTHAPTPTHLGLPGQLRVAAHQPAAAAAAAGKAAQCTAPAAAACCPAQRPSPYAPAAACPAAAAMPPTLPAAHAPRHPHPVGAPGRAPRRWFDQERAAWVAMTTPTCETGWNCTLTQASCLTASPGLRCDLKIPQDHAAACTLTSRGTRAAFAAAAAAVGTSAGAAPLRPTRPCHCGQVQMICTL